MAKINMLQTDGSRGKEIDLPSIFETKVNDHLLYEAVKCYLANQRQGTAKTKTRAEASGGGKKPWRQKGTGHARSGSNTSPIWVRGGKAHGAVPRDYRTSLNRKVRRSALQMALSLKASEGQIKIFESFEVAEPKTKNVVEILGKIGASKAKSLLVLDQPNPKTLRAGRNVACLCIIQVNELSAYDILNCDNLLLTQKSLARIAEVFGS